MVARGRWRTRLAAGGAGMAINAGLLALLTLERPPPLMVEPPALVVALEPRETDRRRTARTPRPGPAPPTLSPRPAPPSSERETVSPPTTEAGQAPSKTVEPRWRVDSGEYLDPATARRARQIWEAAENRRYQRACIGLSSEHMTEEEKFACRDAWGGGAPPAGPDGKRPGRAWPGPPANLERASPGTGTPPG